MTFKVIEVVKDGKIGYLAATSIFVSNSVVEHPMQAINYASDEHAGDLEDDLRNIRLPNDEYYAKSGLPVESAQVVEFDEALQEVSRSPARDPHKARSPQ